MVRVHDYLIILYGRIFSFHKTGISAEEINGYQLIKFKQKLLWEIVSSLPILKKKKTHPFLFKILYSKQF